MKRYIYALLLVLTVTAAGSEVTEDSSKAFIQKWAESFNGNEPKTISAFYDQDARVDMLVSVGSWLRGHKAISESYDRDMKEVKFYDSKLKNLRVRIYDKTALVSFEHLFKYHIVENNTDWRIHIRTTSTLRHTKDGWKIVMEHSSSIKGIDRAVLIEARAHKKGTPEATLISYCNALKSGDLKKAKSLTAKFKTLPSEYLNKYTGKYAKLVKDGEMKIKLVAESMKVIEDCAVLTFEDGDKEHPDYDPAYFVKQNGEWKLLLKFTKWDDRRFTFSDEQKKRFTELKTWFDGETGRLYDGLKDKNTKASE